MPDNDDPLRNTRTTYANPLMRLLVAPYWVNYHLEHHLFMFVPCWRLPQAHPRAAGRRPAAVDGAEARLSRRSQSCNHWRKGQRARSWRTVGAAHLGRQLEKAVPRDRLSSRLSEPPAYWAGQAMDVHLGAEVIRRRHLVQGRHLRIHRPVEGALAARADFLVRRGALRRAVGDFRHEDVGVEALAAGDLRKRAGVGRELGAVLADEIGIDLLIGAGTARRLGTAGSRPEAPAAPCARARWRGPPRCSRSP